MLLRTHKQNSSAVSPFFEQEELFFLDFFSVRSEEICQTINGCEDLSTRIACGL